MINLKPYSCTFEDLEPGQTARVNHMDCPAGTDTRRRLYITRTMADAGLLIAYCHNCAESGRLRTLKSTKYRGPKVGQSTDQMPMVQQIDSNTITKPEGLVYQMADWPIDHRAWAMQNGLCDGWCHKYGIAYDPTTDRIYLPRDAVVHRTGGTRYTREPLKGYQLRNVYKERRTPKYLTVTADTDKGYTMVVSPETTRAVVVEDLVSGIHVAEAWRHDETGVDVFVNYGVKPNLEMLHQMVGNHDEALIWLDNDSQHVRHQAQTMAKTCRLLNSNIKVVVETTFKDPKHYSAPVIRGVVNRI